MINEGNMQTKIKITDYDFKFADNYTKFIKDNFKKNRLNCSLALVSALKNFYKNSDFNFSINTSLFHIPEFLENYEIVDISLNNLNIGISYFFEDNEPILLPKIHFETMIEPSLYLIAKINKDSNTFNIVGHIDSNFLNKIDSNDNYIFIDSNTLNKPQSLKHDITKYLNNSPSQECSNKHEIRHLFFYLMEGNLSLNLQLTLIKHLNSCIKCKNSLVNYYLLEKKYKNNIPNFIEQKINSILQKVSARNSYEEFSENSNESKLKYSLSTIVLNGDNIDTDNINLLYNEENNKNNQSNNIGKDSKFNELKSKFSKVKNRSKKKLIFAYSILSIIVIFLAGVGVFFNYSHNPENNSSLESLDSANKEIPFPEIDYNDKSIEEQKKSLEPIELSLKGISWELSEDEAKNPYLRNYLNDIGKNLKLSLINDFLAINDFVYNDKVRVNIILSRMGTYSKPKIVESSGTKVVDELILTTLNDTLNYIKLPKLKDFDGISLILQINF